LNATLFARIKIGSAYNIWRTARDGKLKSNLSMNAATHPTPNIRAWATSKTVQRITLLRTTAFSLFRMATFDISGSEMVHSTNGPPRPSV
jgi:hypothetical protein